MFLLPACLSRSSSRGNTLFPSNLPVVDVTWCTPQNITLRVSRDESEQDRRHPQTRRDSSGQLMWKGGRSITLVPSTTVVPGYKRIRDPKIFLFLRGFSYTFTLHTL